MKRSVAVVFLLMIAAVDRTLSGQQDPPGIPRFTTETLLIEVPVVVRDSNGHAVGNLRAEDFRLFDNRKEQTITRFEVQKMSASAKPADPGDNVPPAPVVAGSLPTRFVAYLLDDINLVPEDVASGRSAALRQVSALSPATRAAVFSASGRVALDFTEDRDALKQALIRINSLSRVSTWLDPSLRCKPMTYYKAQLIVDGDPGAMADCLGSYDAVRGSNLANAVPSMPEHEVSLLIPPPPQPPGAQNLPVMAPDSSNTAIARQNMVRADAESVLLRGNRDLRSYLGVVSALIDKMSTMPGERLIVLLSPGTYVPRRFQDLQETIIDKAIRAKVSVSGVDVRGVPVAFPMGGDPTTGRNRYGIGEQNLKAGFMTDLAEGTGGVFLRGNNDLDLQLRRAAAAPEYVYVLAFSPPDLKPDGHPHAIQVRLRRSAGYTLQARASYRPPAKERSGPEDVSQEIEDALFSSQELTLLPMEVQTTPLKNAAERLLDVRVRINGSGLRFRDENGRHRDTLIVIAALFDSNGEYLTSFRKDYVFGLDEKAIEKVAASVLEFRRQFGVKPGNYMVRVVARDAGNGATAAHSSRITVVPE